MKNKIMQEIIIPQHDPQIDLQSENEQMRQKLQSEAGAVIECRDDVPPELENVFLKNVLAFEEASQHIQMVSLYDFLGQPEFKKVEDLQPDEIKTELQRLKDLLDEKQVALDIIDTYDDAVIYRFITEELFQEETYESLLPGMIRHYTYETFHPSHRVDIRERVLDFLGDWFDRTLDEHCWELHAEFTLPDSTVRPRAEVVQKIKTIFAAYESFRSCQYALGDITYEWDEASEKGLGHMEGRVKYTGVLKGGEAVTIEGPFTMYLSRQGKWWSIFYFTFPGFNWYDEQ